MVPQTCLDIFSSEATTDFFFTNDQNVLVDIVIRECQDLPPADEVRVVYLQILRQMILNSNWAHTVGGLSLTEWARTRV
jgi:hypothetical protein